MNAAAEATLPATFSLKALAVGGVAGLAAWEVFARLVAPLWIGEALDPTPLVEASLGIGGTGAFVVHVLTGLVAYPAAWMLVAWPIAARLGLPWWLAAIGYGVGLWVFALGVMAGLVAGFPLFLGFIPLAWASLVGHVLLAVAAAGAMRAAG